MVTHNRLWLEESPANRIAACNETPISWVATELYANRNNLEEFPNQRNIVFSWLFNITASKFTQFGRFSGSNSDQMSILKSAKGLNLGNHPSVQFARFGAWNREQSRLFIRIQAIFGTSGNRLSRLTGWCWETPSVRHADPPVNFQNLVENETPIAPLGAEL